MEDFLDFLHVLPELTWQVFFYVKEKLSEFSNFFVIRITFRMSLWAFFHRDMPLLSINNVRNAADNVFELNICWNFLQNTHKMLCIVEQRKIGRKEWETVKQINENSNIFYKEIERRLLALNHGNMEISRYDGNREATTHNPSWHNILRRRRIYLFFPTPPTTLSVAGSFFTMRLLIRCFQVLSCMT